MAKDKPSFLNNIGDDQEERDVMSVLENDPTPETPAPPSEQKPETTETPEIKPEEKGTPEVKPPVKVTPEKKPDMKAAPEIKPEIKKEEPKLIMGKYKSVEEFEKAHKELQRSFDKLKTELPKEPAKPDEMDVFRKTPVIQARIPDPARYYFKNQNGDEVLDLQAYMKDTLNSFAVSVQQNLLGGPLASAVFGMLGKAVLEEQSKSVETARREEWANTVWTNVQTSFPILAKDDRLGALYEKAIYGEKMRRNMEAKKNNTEPVDMTEEDYMNLAKEIVGSQPITPTPETPETVEPLKSDSAMQEQTVGATSVEKQISQDIDDMLAVKSKQLF